MGKKLFKTTLGVGAFGIMSIFAVAMMGASLEGWRKFKDRRKPATGMGR